MKLIKIVIGDLRANVRPFKIAAYLGFFFKYSFEHYPTSYSIDTVFSGKKFRKID